MIIDDFNVVSIAIPPRETDAPLVVDPNAMLTDSIAGEKFQAISWGYAQIGKLIGGIEQGKFALGNTLDHGR